jgi:hypothetical protein
MEGGAVGHNFEMGLPKDYPSQICFNLVQWFQRRRFKCDLLSKAQIFYCSYIARSSLTCIPSFYVKFFFQPIFTDYANKAYFDKRSAHFD